VRQVFDKLRRRAKARKNRRRAKVAGRGDGDVSEKVRRVGGNRDPRGTDTRSGFGI
jgi:hypothetical protein